jgi:hypothetical protein
MLSNLVPSFKKANSVAVSNYRPIYILNKCSKLFEFVIYDDVWHYLKFKSNPFQHGFITFESAITNFVNLS